MIKRVIKSDAEWQARLSPLAYKVTRKHATEPAFSHDDFAKSPGVFTCICCGADLFGSDAKFNSGTGWPSFTTPIDGAAVGESQDRSWIMRRTEVHCARCDAHLGHVFADGPAPAGQRYCLNGVALGFRGA